MDLLILLLILGGGFLVWRTNLLGKRLEAAEFELGKLREILLSLRNASPQAVETPKKTAKAAKSAITVVKTAPAGPWEEAATQAIAKPPVLPEPALAKAPQPEPEKPSARPVQNAPAETGGGSFALPSFDLEKHFATRWPIWVGGLAFALGGIFLVRYSIERGMFGPGMRLAMSAIAGLSAMAGGEYLRRRDIKLAFAGDRAAQVPAILTAAGAAILFAVVYAAHAVFGFIGPTPAFALLAVISLATLAASLLHGSALAALGLLGAFVTPFLVSSEAPNVWTLFAYLAVVLVAASALARHRNQIWIMAAAIAGQGGWTLLYRLFEPNSAPLSTAFAIGVAAGAVALIWCWRRPAKAGEDSLSSFAAPAAIASTLAVLSVFVLLAMAQRSPNPDIAPLADAFPVWSSALLAAAFLLAMAARHRVALAGLEAAALIGIADQGALLRTSMTEAATGGIFALPHSLTAGVLFFAAGLAMAWHQAARRNLALGWALLGAALPLQVYFVSLYKSGNWDFDWRYGLTALVLAAVYAGAAHWQDRRETDLTTLLRPSSLYLVASAILVLAAVPLLSNSAWTGILLALIAVGLAWLTARRLHGLIPWLACGFGIAVFARFGFDPGILQPGALSTRPVFNWLLAAYGVPSLAFGVSAWLFARSGDLLPRRIMEGMAATAALAGAGMLVRHAMHGGVLDFVSEVTLSEQSVYTLMALGTSATLIRLDQKAPSPVFTIGSMLIGYAGMASAFVQHLLHLNPVFTGESTGNSQLVNLVSLAYLLPALTFAALWFYARTRRPFHYVASLAGMTILFAAAWLALAVRHWHLGGDISGRLGADTPELLSYLPVFLVASALAFAASRKGLAMLLQPLGAAMMALAVTVFAALSYFAANPLFSGRPTSLGQLALAFLLPALLFAALRFLFDLPWPGYVRRVRLAIGILTGMAGFVWVSLSIRAYWQGPDIAIWQRTSAAETYTYSVVWLLLGLALLGLGARFGSRPLRLASAIMVTLTTLKVFLVDMSELEGVLRAFSFMGLGVALIGIGLLYQRVLKDADGK